MVIGKGSTTAAMATEEIQELFASVDAALLMGAGLAPVHKRVLVIIPDRTGTTPIPLFFRLLYEQFGYRAAQLDYLIALGTQQPLSPAAIDHLAGATDAERAAICPMCTFLTMPGTTRRCSRQPN